MAEVGIKDFVNSSSVEVLIVSIGSPSSPGAAINTGSGVLDSSTLHNLGSINIDRGWSTIVMIWNKSDTFVPVASNIHAASNIFVL